MPAFVTLDRLVYKTPDGRELLDNLTLSFSGERTGLVGRNGVGKTTLLRLILGELAPSSGSVAVQGSLGVLRQALTPEPGASVADLMGVAEGLQRLTRIATGEGTADDLAEADWTLEARVEAALADVGLEGLSLDRPAVSLSGGEATRAALASLIVAEPDLLILDEPTNNLDAEARRLLERIVAERRGGVLAVSHDRGLLRQMDRIVELSGLGARIYGGDYDLYVAQKAAETEAAQRKLAAVQRDAARVERDVQAARERQARRDSAGRRARARGDAPKILLDAQAGRAERTAARGSRLAERQRDAARQDLTAAQARVERVRNLDFDLPPTGLAEGKVVLIMEDVAFAHPGEEPLIAGFDLRIAGPERIGLVGPNGSGKSTLIALATGALAPQRGLVRLGVDAAVLDQRAAALREGETLVEAYRRLNPAGNDHAAHEALARFLFRGEAGRRKVGELSGGERLRAAMACALCRPAPPQLIILDEPTNHLDLDSITAVETAVSAYDGAVLAVSHDPDFLDAIGIEREIRLRPAG